MAEDRVDEKLVERQKLWTGFKLVIKDIRTWIFAVMLLSRKSLQGLYYYLPSLIDQAAAVIIPGSKLGHDKLALLLGAPASVLAALLAFTFAYTSDKFNQRSFDIAGPLFMGMIGTIVTLCSQDQVIRYTSVYLYLAGSIVGSEMTYAWVANVIQETLEKKAIGIAVVNLVGGVGSAYSPFLFRQRDAPGYHMEFGVVTGFIALDIVCVFVMR